MKTKESIQLPSTSTTHNNIQTHEDISRKLRLELVNNNEKTFKKYKENVPNTSIFIKPKNFKFVFQMCGKYEEKILPVDYSLFVQSWPGELCDRMNCHVSTNTRFVPEGFLIHGFWPQSNEGFINCCSNENSIENVENLILTNKELKKEIGKYWFSKNKCRFALYEFDKHGSCTLDVFKGERGPLDYYWMVINLRKNIDIWTLLKESELKVKPMNRYKFVEIKNVLKQQIGVEPVIKSTNFGSIAEVVICYDLNEENKHNPKPINCPYYMYENEWNNSPEYIYFKPFPEAFKNIEKTTKTDCDY
ncbi:ribonuclease DdI precursor, putative [Entamoeba invadens IP1]|uniref:Ribonuclease DdI, putative n=1 Tax=Entamoeba invadens IP1 TaxID=370355 RepID=L7FMY2_ENTIV|nr:ribonuclease DdI precursor, putative [Entamoeba invadens IP1]ELP90960.1 ribonuclease DdI precursor, putative [Entamoeba invadens IP1]|eukprot:XP_004257731.1 ribonuclease DdI precursor, putative [Entamoeba invadens IP1]